VRHRDRESGTLIPLGIPAFAPELGASNTQSFTKINPAGTVSYQWTPDVSTYIRVATGYKAGGSSEAARPGTFTTTCNPETLTQYEVGLKSYWLDRRVRVNAAAFHSDLKDVQLNFNTSPAAADLAYVLTANAGSETIDGLELETLCLPVTDLTLGVNWTYLDAKIKTVSALQGTIFDPAVNPASPYAVGQNIAQIFTMPYAPKNVFNVNADWTFLHAQSGSAALQRNYRYQDRQFMSAPAGPGVPNSEALYSIAGYGLLDVRPPWSADLASQKRLRASLWAQNATGKYYPLHLIGQGSVVATPGALFPVGCRYQAIAWAPKPAYGIDLSYGF
jgi:iron complex outermembrane receptor protein